MGNLKNLKEFILCVGNYYFWYADQYIVVVEDQQKSGIEQKLSQLKTIEVISKFLIILDDLMQTFHIAKRHKLMHRYPFVVQ